MSSSAITKHYQRLLTLWPKDPLRPNLPFTRTLEHRLARFSPKPTEPSSTTETPSTPKTIKFNPTASKDAKPSSPLPASALDAKAELVNINAVYSLLENRYSKRYPLSEALFNPTSNPNHYETLIADLDRAPTKSWLQAKMDQWKMMIRWK